MEFSDSRLSTYRVCAYAIQGEKEVSAVKHFQKHPLAAAIGMLFTRIASVIHATFVSFAFATGTAGIARTRKTSRALN